MGFSDAEEQKADQEFTLTAKDYLKDIELRFVKFQNVDRVTVYLIRNLDIHRR